MINPRSVVSVLAAAGCTLLPALATAQPQPSSDAPATPADAAPAAPPAAPAPPPAAAPAAAPAATPPPAASSSEAASDKDSGPSKNSVYAEGLGAGLLWSINYERMVLPQLGVRVGFGYLSFSTSASLAGTTASSSVTEIFIPITASYTGLRSGKSSLEVGGGATIVSVSGSANSLGAHTTGSGIVPVGDILLGYRLQPTGGKAGFMFRVGAMGLIGEGFSLSSNANPKNIGVIPWGYISFGASF